MAQLPKKQPVELLVILVLLFLIPAFSFASDSKALEKAKYSVVFDSSKYITKSNVLNGKTISYRAYENIVYIQNPVDPQIQNMNIYVPVEYYEGKNMGTYSINTAPIFFPNTVGGYMPGPAGSPGVDFMNHGPNAALVALSKGYIVAEPGVRGRTSVDATGRYIGKAPAVIVDLKAAVRYLRFNDKLIPGDSEKIISNGTSAGGAVSALLGATGNNTDYEPYLKVLGAADARDDIFAVSAYCPITNLENADMAYEWLFSGINDYTKMVFQGPPPAAGAKAPGAAGTMTPGGQIKPVIVKGTMNSEQIKIAAQLKALFPTYLNTLQLKRTDGTVLTLDAEGNGSFKDYIKSYIMASAQKDLNAGSDLSKITWLTIKNKIVEDMNFEQYLQFATRMKSTSAFDGLDMGNAENELFGTENLNAKHFTQFGQDHSTVASQLADASIIKLMNPLNYIGTQGTATSKYWRIRHGTVDRDTSLAVPAILAIKLQNAGYSVDFALPWNRPHSGDYDLDELFSWIEQICQ